MTIKCLIVDDEPLALDLLEGYISRTPGLELSGKCNSALKAMEVLDSQTVDLMFLDIQMPDLSGLEFSKALKQGPKIIFTTAFEKYALESYKVDAIDYLLKPISYNEFLVSVEKAKKWFKLVNQKGGGNADDYIMVKSDYKLIRIDFKEVLYVEGVKDYAKFYLETTDKPVVSLVSLKSLESKFPQDQFMRIHRSFIVNLDKIKLIERGYIVFGDKHIPVSEKYKDQFKQFLMKGGF